MEVSNIFLQQLFKVVLTYVNVFGMFHGAFFAVRVMVVVMMLAHGRMGCHGNESVLPWEICTKKKSNMEEVKSIKWTHLQWINYIQCCQRHGLPTELGYFEIACRGSKNCCWACSLKLGYFLPSTCGSSFYFKFASFLSIQRVVEPSQCPRTLFSSISRIKTSWRAINIDYLLHGEVNNLIIFQFNYFSTQLRDFDYFTAGKNQNLGNWVYNYLIKIGLLWSRLPLTKKSICSGLVPGCKFDCIAEQNAPHFRLLLHKFQLV